MRPIRLAFCEVKRSINKEYVGAIDEWASSTITNEILELRLETEWLSFFMILSNFPKPATKNPLSSFEISNLLFPQKREICIVVAMK